MLKAAQVGKPSCEPCRKGYYCPGLDGGAAGPLQCPTGLTTAAEGAKDISQCVTLPGWGRYRKEAASGKLTYVGEECDTGSWNSGGNRLSCRKCAKGLTTLDTGDSSLLLLDEVAALLAKEQLNSYGLLAPLQHQQASSSSSRRLRGGGLYPAAALVNHECLPNLARFDALDAAGGGPLPAHWPANGGGGGAGGPSSTAVVLRALHELPPGTELSQSYFPLNWNLEERQQQAQQVYGFTCTCPRCLLESSPEWQQQQEEQEEQDCSSGEWQTDSGDEAAAAEAADMDADTHHHHTKQQQPADQQQQQAAPLDPAYLSLFMLKYMCPVESCFGTMAAVQGTDLCECSVCGATRSEAQFLAELEDR